jgi:hypothetical protein
MNVTTKLLKQVINLDAVRVGVVTSWTARVRFPALQDFLHSFQTGSGAHPASHPMDTGRGDFPGSKAAEAWSRPLTSI